MRRLAAAAAGGEEAEEETEKAEEAPEETEKAPDETEKAPEKAPEETEGAPEDEETEAFDAPEEAEKKRRLVVGVERVERVERVEGGRSCCQGARGPSHGRSEPVPAHGVGHHSTSSRRLAPRRRLFHRPGGDFCARGGARL